MPTLVDNFHWSVCTCEAALNINSIFPVEPTELEPPFQLEYHNNYRQNSCFRGPIAQFLVPEATTERVSRFRLYLPVEMVVLEDPVIRRSIRNGGLVPDANRCASKPHPKSVAIWPGSHFSQPTRRTRTGSFDGPMERGATGYQSVPNVSLQPLRVVLARRLDRVGRRRSI